MVEIHQVDTTDRRDVERFVQFPFHLYRDSRQWVPPVVSSARKQLDRERHIFYRNSDADFFLTLQDGEVTGRIAVIEPRKRNTFRRLQGAFFCMFESVDDDQTAHALFTAAFDWARRRGLDEISGPEGFSSGDAKGILVKGFDHRPAMGVGYNPDYYDRLVRAAGFAKQTDYHSAYLPGDIELPERFVRVATSIKERRGYEILRFRSRRELKAFAPRVVEAYNAAFVDNREHVPITGADATRAADRIISMTQPDLIKVVAKDGHVIGFTLGFPDVSAALQRCRGRLYPFGLPMLMREMNRTRWVNFNGGGILPQYQGLGANAVLYHEMYKTVQERKFQHADIVQVNEQNSKMVQELEALGADLYKRHRIYERSL